VFDRTRKLEVCAREGVAHAWLVDPVPRTPEVLRLEDWRWTLLAACAGDEAARAEPFTENAALGDVEARASTSNRCPSVRGEGCVGGNESLEGGQEVGGVRVVGEAAQFSEARIE
jgi:hypothetical protein